MLEKDGDISHAAMRNLAYARRRARLSAPGLEDDIASRAMLDWWQRKADGKPALMRLCFIKALGEEISQVRALDFKIPVTSIAGVYRAEEAIEAIRAARVLNEDELAGLLDDYRFAIANSSIKPTVRIARRKVRRAFAERRS